MPWKPSDAKGHTEKADTPAKQKVWAKVANDRLQACLDEDGEQATCEASAIKQANSVVAKMEERAIGLLRMFWDAITAPFKPQEEQEQPEERAIALQLVFDQIMGALEESGRWAWIHDVYREDDGSFFAVISEVANCIECQSISQAVQ